MKTVIVTGLGLASAESAPQLSLASQEKAFQSKYALPKN